MSKTLDIVHFNDVYRVGKQKVYKSLLLGIALTDVVIFC